MSQNKNLQQSLSGISNGFSTGIALQLWLFFLFCFYFLGYPVPLCILLGLAGGLGGGLIIGWWKTKDQPIEVRPVELEEEETSERISGLRSAKRRRDAAKSRKRSPGVFTSFGSLLKR